MAHFIFRCDINWHHVSQCCAIVAISRFYPQYEYYHNDYNFDRVRKDSLVMERASRSHYVMNIYGFCGFATFSEFGQEGNLADIQYEYDIPNVQKLKIATQIAQGLADVHNLDGDDRSSMTHGDLTSKQFIFINGYFKLNDFNGGRLLSWNPKKNETCPYEGGFWDHVVRVWFQHFRPNWTRIHILSFCIEVPCTGSIQWPLENSCDRCMGIG